MRAVPTDCQRCHWQCWQRWQPGSIIWGLCVLVLTCCNWKREAETPVIGFSCMLNSNDLLVLQQGKHRKDITRQVRFSKLLLDPFNHLRDGLHPLAMIQ